MTKTIKGRCGKCGGSKNNTPYIEEFEKEIKSNSYFANQHEGNEFVLKASRAIEIVAEHLTKTIEEERERAIEDFITKMFGKRCKEYEEGCPVCDEWKLYDEYIK